MLSTLLKTVWQFLKKWESQLCYDLTILLLDIYSRWHENLCAHKDLYTDLHSSFVHCNPKLHILQISNNSRKTNQILEYSYKEIQLNNKKNTAKKYNIIPLCWQEKDQHTKKYILCNWVLEQAKLSDQWLFLRVLEVGVGHWLGSCTREVSGVIEILCFDVYLST